jgi:anti-anti-sigma factor
MDMTVLQRDDEITHVALAGRLDTTGAEKINQSLSEATAGKNRPAIVDLSGVDFMASRGIAILFANSKKLKQGGHKLVLLNPQEMVEGVLTATKMDKAMPIARDLDEAVQIALGKRAQAAAARPRPAPAAEEAAPRQVPPVSPAAAPREGAVKVVIKNEASELVALNATLGQFLHDHSVPSRATYAVNLAIDELVVNVMRYAYADADTHLIEIELAVEGEHVVLRIVDDGRPFDPRKGPALDLNAEDREIGGLGLILVLEMVDVLRYQRVENKNRAEVRIRLVPDEASSQPEEVAAEPVATSGA